MTVTAVVMLRAHPERGQALLAALEQNLNASRSEPGLLKVDVMRDLDDPRTVVLVESWSDRDALNTHLETAHVGSFRRAARDLLESFEVRVLAPLVLPA